MLWKAPGLRLASYDEFQNMSMWKRQASPSVAVRVDNLNPVHVSDKLSGSRTMYSSEALYPSGVV